jgi:pyruvate dehydrogenase E2 component (dihydrolipoamide acetyltransferase)
MVTDRQFRLPDLGEGLTEADIVRWLVEAGDRVTTNQPLLEVETAKAVVEVPSPFTGVVVAVHGAAGETVPVGTALVTVDVAEADGGPGEPGEHGGPAGSRRSGPVPDDTHGGPEQQQVLVGYGPRPPAAPTRRPRRTRRGGAGMGATGVGAATALGTSAVLGATAAGGTPAADQPAGGGNGTGGAPGPVLAKPPVRKLARDLGVDLRGIVGTGPQGTISRADVEAAAGPAVIPHPTAGTTSPPRPSGPRTATPGRADPTAPARPGQIPLGARFDPTSRTWLVPVTGVRRATAKAMVASAFTAPHVTEFIAVDMTGTMAARDRLAALPEFADVKVTPLLFVAKALLTAVRRYPAINASWVRGAADPGDPAAQIVMHEAVNLGVAVASPRGLLVPNIPDAGRLGLVELAHTLHRLTADARAGRVAPADLTGGTITITNVGVFGVDIGTPILNPGEAAILALGAVRPAPWVHEGQLAVRTVAQLALSFDHRMVDGELGSAVLADVAAMLTDPTVLLAWS